MLYVSDCTIINLELPRGTCTSEFLISPTLRAYMFLGRSWFTYRTYGPRLNHYQCYFLTTFPKNILFPLAKRWKNLEVFAPKPQITKTTHHEIRLATYTCFRIPSYRYSDSKKQVIQEQIKEMLADEILERNQSKFNSPVVIVKKARCCVDYRKLNSITKTEPTPLPIIH